ncbi:MAG: acetamidase/formamidase family protein [Chthoniobacterales bacterium]
MPDELPGKLPNKPTFRYRLAVASPVKKICSGETITVTLPDSDARGPNLQPLEKTLFEDNDTNRGNPLFGPVAIESAALGDTLIVHFQKIIPDVRPARTWLAPGHGFASDELLLGKNDDISDKPEHMFLWDLQDGFAQMQNPIGEKSLRVPTAPFLGAVGVATAAAPSTMLAGKHGGNIDHPDLTAGSTLWLPVFAESGLLYFGDMHAAQGQGETAGGGLEISGTVTLRVELLKNKRIHLPRYQTPDGAAALGVGKDFKQAAEEALAAMTHWIASEGWNLFDANMFVNQTCELRPGGLAESYSVVSCFIPKPALELNDLPLALPVEQPGRF